MTDKAIQECNQKCRAKYGNWSEPDLRNKLLELDPKENPFQLDERVPKEGLITKICAIECKAIEEGWRS